MLVQPIASAVRTRAGVTTTSVETFGTLVGLSFGSAHFDLRISAGLTPAWAFGLSAPFGGYYPTLGTHLHGSGAIRGP